MVRGPLGGPRPLADSERRIIITVGVRDDPVTDNMRRKLESDLRRELIQYVKYESHNDFLHLSERPMASRYSLTLPETTSNVMEIVVMVNDNTVRLDSIRNIEEEARRIINSSGFRITGVSTTIG